MNVRVDENSASSSSAAGMAGGVRCKWRGGVVANDGNIYCAPDCADAVLCIEPAARHEPVVGASSAMLVLVLLRLPGPPGGRKQQQDIWQL